MEATIDRFGRIVIPKELRDHHGLKPGSIVRISSSDDEITLVPVDSQPHLSREKGVLVISTEILEAGDVVSFIKKQREIRDLHLVDASGGKGR